jgi:hypothetical protein
MEKQGMRTGWVEMLECDLTDEQRQLCEWIAQQAQAGITRVYYEEAQAALGIVTQKELTCMLRNLRERVDWVHAMVHSPIVHTVAPYFDIHPDAGRIWDQYLLAEERTLYAEPEAVGLRPAPVPC